MKKIFMLLVFVFISQNIVAQTPAATLIVPDGKGTTGPVEVTGSYFCCRSCDYTANKLQSCPLHSTLLIKVGDWYCPVDGKSHNASGKCSRDQADLVKMEMKFKTVTPKPEDLKKEEPIKKK